MNLHVLIAGEVAGTLDLSGAEPEFVYGDDYSKGMLGLPLSVAFPVAERRAGGEPLEHWLEGLLPDDPDVISALCSEYGFDPSDRLLLLGTPMGADCAGAVQVCPPDRLVDLRAGRGSQEPIDESGIGEWLTRMETEPAKRAYRSEGADSGFSIGGMQPKVALRRTGGRWSVPMGAIPSTHIIKASRDKWPHEAVVEHLTMRAASECGIAAARTEVDWYGDKEVIVVERFDRSADGNSRIHQEDMCQALGHPPRRKYQRNRGPAPEDIAEMFRQAGPDEAEQNIARFLDHLLYLWVVADTDGHAKNYSILHFGDGSINLSPMYDACSWLPYRKGKFVKKLQLAMKVGTDFSLKAADSADGLERTAARLRLQPAAVARRASEIASSVPGALDNALDTVPSHARQFKEVQALTAELPERAEHCLAIAESAAEQFAQSESPLRISVVPASPGASMPERCQHTGVKSRKQCIRPAHEDKRHWYQ